MIMTNHRGLDEDDEKEVDERKRRLDLLKQEHAKRNGVAHPDKAPALDPAKLDAELPDRASHKYRARTGKPRGRRPQPASAWKPAPKAQELLDAAAKLYKPGEPASPGKLAETLGWPSGRVSVRISDLRKRGAWPYTRFAPPPKRHTVPKKGNAVEEFPALRARILGEEPRPTAPVVTSREPSDQEKVAKGCLCAEKGRITVRKLILATGLSSQRVYAAVIALKRQGAFPYELVEGKSATSRLPDNKPVRLRDGARSTLLQRMEESEADDEEDDHPPIEDLADVDPVEEDGAVPACVDDDQVDPELLAMNRLLRELKSWDPDARRRIVSYLADRLGPIPQL